MKIAILGTRGVPNYHGGFEQFAEHLSVFLVKKGHTVHVYNSKNHPYQDKKWQGVNILHKHDPEDKIGTAGQFIYDLNCILDSRKQHYDIILQLGYTSSSIWHKLMPKHSIIITNMDGLEWKRTKYSKPVQRFLKYAEKLAVQSSDYLVADSIAIQDYLKKKYNHASRYIAYGATVFSDPNENVLKEYGLIKRGYNLLIARLEPENNIETILNGVIKSKNTTPFLVIGKHNTKYGEHLKRKYQEYPRILFLGGIYNQNHLNNLRYFSNLYFHGHSVGGTNPSLLEAMASNTLIAAHSNEFNSSILGSDAFYFKNPEEVSSILEEVNKANHLDKLESCRNKIVNMYQWESINGKYLDFFIECVKKANRKI